MPCGGRLADRAYRVRQYFSALMATSDTRAGFIKILQDALSTYGFDGIDIDCESTRTNGGRG